jgi:hypothetical protein
MESAEEALSPRLSSKLYPEMCLVRLFPRRDPPRNLSCVAKEPTREARTCASVPVIRLKQDD